VVSSQVIGPVVDVRFDGELPDIMSALEVCWYHSYAFGKQQAADPAVS
jgi:F0F1-type ATP synthase beta subunit